MTTLKLQAEVLRIGILGGYVSPEEAIAWADALIESLSPAPADLIEVSLSGGRRDDVASALAQVSGSFDEESLRRTLLRKMADIAFSRPQFCRQIARALYQLAVEGRAPTRADESAMFTFDDAYDLAESGAFGTIEDVDAELREYLSSWRSEGV